jgi:hypothetical protein
MFRSWSRSSGWNAYIDMVSGNMRSLIELIHNTVQGLCVRPLMRLHVYILRISMLLTAAYSIAIHNGEFIL